MMKMINAQKAPQAIGPYSHAVQVGDLLFTSGNLPINPETNQLTKGIEKQTKQVLENVKIVLNEAGFELKDVVKTTCFLKDMNDFSAFNEVYAQYITHKPARSCVAVREIPNNALCEIEVIAYKKPENV